MPQLKARQTHARFFVGESRDRTKLDGITADQDRMRLIRECLTELIGVELIYAIRCTDGVVKIGHTADIKNRRKFFDAAPEAILAVQRGTYEEEQDLHAQLRASVARGVEYYHPTEQVMAVVNAMRSELGVEPIAA